LKILKYLFVVALLLHIISVKAQTTGEWIGSDLTVKMPHNLSFKIKGQGRILNNEIGLYKYLLQYGLKYKFSKRVDVAFQYRSSFRKEKDDNFHYRNKMFADFCTDIPVARFKIENRLRYQHGTKTYINSDKDLIPKQYVRDKFVIRYDIKNCKVTPMIFGELFFPLNINKPEIIDEYRLGCEIKYKINGNQSFKTGIMYQNDQTAFPLSNLLFRITYSFDIRVFK